MSCLQADPSEATRMTSARSRRWSRPAAPELLVVLTASSVFIALRTTDYTAVDGALRCLAVYWDRSVQFHQLNHFLHPFNVWLWTTGLGAVGLHADTPATFLAYCQALNATAAAVTLACLFRAAYLVTGSSAAAGVAVLALACTRAFLLHATNAAEPPVGLAFGMASIWLALEGGRAGGTWAFVLAGAAASAAALSYLTMSACGVIALLICSRGPHASWSPRQVGVFVVSGLLTTTVIIVTVLTTAGALDFTTISWLAELRDNHVYGGFSAAKLANLPFGFAHSVLPVLPEPYAGLRWAASAGPAVHARLMLAIAVVLAVVASAYGLFVTGGALARVRTRVLVLLLVVVGVGVFPLIYREPLYDKLWLQPLAVFALLLGSIWAGSGSPNLRRLVVAGAAATLLVNIGAAVESGRQPTPWLHAAETVFSATRDGSLVVVDFDEVSQLYGMFKRPSEVLVLPADPRGWRESLDSAVAEAADGGRPVYFLGVLDQSRGDWDAFLGSKVRIPFETFDRYRRESTVVHGCTVNGVQVTLRRWSAARRAAGE
jgi:hypothetical protein